MQTAVAQLRAALTSRYGAPKRYEEFEHWSTGNSSHTRFTLYFDGRRCRIYASDRTSRAPELLTEIETPEAVAQAMVLIERRVGEPR
jgi:hypothetical protein